MSERRERLDALRQELLGRWVFAEDSASDEAWIEATGLSFDELMLGELGVGAFGVPAI